MSANQDAATLAAGDGQADASAVLSHHLGAFAQGIDELMVDYDDQSVLVTQENTLQGREQIRSFFQDFLNSATPAFWQAFELRTSTVTGEIAYIVWTAVPFVTLATDTLHIRNGIISTQTFTSYAP